MKGKDEEKSEEQEEEIKFLSPKKESLRVKGDLFYSESRQAWCILRFKKEILHEFPQLREKMGVFGYVMTISRSYDDLRKSIEEFEKGEDVVPMLLMFCKKKG